VNSYFQRLTAQTHAVGVEAAPQQSALPTEDLIEVHEEHVAEGWPRPLDQMLFVSPKPETSAPAQIPNQPIAPPIFEPTPERLPEKTSHPLPPALAKVLPNTPVIQEVVRWLAAAPTVESPSKPEAASIPAKDNPPPQQEIRTHKSPPSTPSNPRVISVPFVQVEEHETVLERQVIKDGAVMHLPTSPTVMEESVNIQILEAVAEKPVPPMPKRSSPGTASTAYAVTAKTVEQPVSAAEPMPMPELTVSIGAMHVTIETPPVPAPVQQILPPRPQPVAQPIMPSTRRDLSRHYL
jgi:hypothetical protein